MKIAIISGSHRVESQSKKVANFIQEMLHAEFKNNIETLILDLGSNPLPDWDESKWDEKCEKWKTEWQPISQQLRECSAFVVVCPEWGGMVTPRLKNLFLLCDDYELSHKPGLIVSVSSGRGGSYPVAELRMSSYKNTYILWLPEHVIIQNVDNVLNEIFKSSSESDDYIQSRLLYSLRLLNEYADKLSMVRQSGLLNHEKFPYGM